MATFKGYIAYYIRNLKSVMPDSVLRSFIIRGMGSDVDEASDKNLRNVAFSLYYINFIGHGICYSDEGIMGKNKTVKQLRELLEEIAEFREKLGFPIQITFYTESGAVTQHMQKFQEPITVLKKFLEAGKETKTIKSSKPVAKKAHSKSVKSSPPKPVAKKSTSKSSTKSISKSTSSVTTSKSKTIDSYTVVELRNLAVKEGIPGRSKMKKAELYESLKRMKAI
jgi:hypothetical protein